ncbi:MAG TPA: permease [Hydrogenophaga sp.]|uniref:esterase/lipase family protein n=1 Tax=Hydrogenophaga sp. TaxID=1904254 RepID=UPI0008AE5920|nr:alpha/beta hydrolase [Hydrogenophaga sp.]OGA75331.1 MAG: permease [Burkholderiales bacterium GWE1_65_30]OGA93463.1 MAG: permease [Burkholderiales bacterium GWF1_66_17]HAX19474.1 permease [Hydrogenophaga sp.]HBU17790.1 permease [Hydrogenophaga sp.]
MTAPTPPNNPKRAVLRHLRPSDLRAAAQLASQATQGVINITEGVHQSVRRRLGFSSGASDEQASGLTGQIYRGVRGVAHIVGHGLDGALATLLPLVDDPATHPEDSPAREAVLAALNGVLGDRLQSFGNPLAQTMELRQGGQTLPLVPAALKARLGEQASPHLLLLAHGLCMNDTQWRRSGHDHGDALAQALGCTPVYLRYNSGLHTSINGHQLALLLEQLVAAWPVPLERLTIVGHSMGGLVARSAVQVAREAGQRWPGLLRELVFLGTPHHGAPLERAGHGVDLLLASSPHTAPFARLGKIRSAGITDLRHGHVLDADWQGRDRFGSPEDHRVPLPLPEGVACFAVAATLAGQRGLLADRLMGDGLVPLHSALGQHDDLARRLVFAKDSQHIVYRTGHLDLLSSPEVAAQMLAWLRPAPAVEE